MAGWKGGREEERKVIQRSCLQTMPFQKLKKVKLLLLENSKTVEGSRGIGLGEQGDSFPRMSGPYGEWTNLKGSQSPVSRRVLLQMKRQPWSLSTVPSLGSEGHFPFWPYLSTIIMDPYLPIAILFLKKKACFQLKMVSLL